MNKKEITQRLNRIIGQLEGVKKMLDLEKECTDILTQFKAANSALSNATKTFAKSQINSCFENKLENNKEKELENILDSIIRN